MEQWGLASIGQLVFADDHFAKHIKEGTWKQQSHVDGTTASAAVVAAVAVCQVWLGLLFPFSDRGDFGRGVGILMNS